ASSVPVVNLLSDLGHPLQAIADLLTIRAEFGSFEGRRIAWIGDHSNVARSLGLAAGTMGMGIHFGCPDGYGPPPADLEAFRAAGSPDVSSTTDPAEAVRD